MLRSLLLVVVNNTTSNEGLSSQGRMDVFCLFSQPSARTMFVIMENLSFTGFNSRAQPPPFCGDMTGRYYSVATASGRGATRQLVTEGGTGECQSKRLGDPPQLNITPLRNKKFFIRCGTSYSLYRVPQSSVSALLRRLAPPHAPLSLDPDAALSTPHSFAWWCHGTCT